MLDIGWPELLVVAIVLIVVVGPKDLPKMLRTFGKTTSKMRSMANDFRRQFDDALREAELEDVKSIADTARQMNPTNSIRKALDPLSSAGNEIKKSLDDATRAKPDITKGGEAKPKAETPETRSSVKTAETEGPAKKTAVKSEEGSGKAKSRTASATGNKKKSSKAGKSA